MSASTLNDCWEPTRGDDGAFPPSSACLGSSTRPPRRPFFDPWNSSSTGHQRAENRLSGSTSWRASRGSKLGEQYRAGLTGGGERVADTVGAGSPDFGIDGRRENGDWEKGAKGLRTGGQRSLVDIWRATKAGQRAVVDKKSSRGPHSLEDAQVQGTSGSASPAKRSSASGSLEVLSQDTHHEPLGSASPLQQRPIFEGLCFFVNGSTAPHVSDHKLKHMLSAYGGRHSIALGRRTVTHVVLGAANTKRGGGGGLAATKMQKEVDRTGGKAIKYVTVEW